MPFIKDVIEPGSVVHTDGWPGYLPLETEGYHHRVTVLKGKRESASELLPRVHRVASLLKRWLLGTHQGAVSREHLDYYLDEFTFQVVVQVLTADRTLVRAQQPSLQQRRHQMDSRQQLRRRFLLSR